MIGFGVVFEVELKEIVYDVKNCSEKIVMINGCFDIFYLGYVFYLENVWKLGDCLIVVVNMDELVKCLKGEVWLINYLVVWMVVFVGLVLVDWVVLFDEDIF